ncbi:L-threonylcarbamoyladenylate synthase [Primorskyibacter sp. S187A]|uniref:L-threonylcarbamoyladenylate synthase n=1 Tax=Primorskyibacter sp. S187A TaxID=3415130 RepID=UPI003C7B8AAD
MKIQTERLEADPDGIARAARLLRDGRLVAFATETVYGLGADATQGDAVARIYEAKGRPAFNPLIVHVASIDAAQRLVTWSALAQRLAEAFWPGPLTLVLPLKPEAGVSSLVTAGLPTLAVRMPQGAAAQVLLRAADRPIAAPSANPSGRISSVSADHVMAGLGGRIDAVLDAGPCQVGLESTIVAVGEHVQLLRPGGIPQEALEQVLGAPLQQPETGAITSPGQLASHYAPGARVRLNATSATPDEILIGFGPVQSALTLSASGDLREAAARLFAILHEADADGRPIAVAPVPMEGLGQAINDRLRRAAAPRK